MALERVPADIRAEGGVARMADPTKIREIQEAVSIPVMAKARIGHFVEAQILEALEVDYVDESEVLTPADEAHHIDKWAFNIPFVCGCRNLGEALRRLSEGAAMIRTKGEAGTGDIVNAVRHMRAVFGDIRRLGTLSPEELYTEAKELQAPVELVRWVAENGRLPVVTFTAGGHRDAGRRGALHAARRGRRVRRLRHLQVVRPARRAPRRSSRRRRTSPTRRRSPASRRAWASRCAASTPPRSRPKSCSRPAAGSAASRRHDRHGLGTIGHTRVTFSLLASKAGARGRRPRGYSFTRKMSDPTRIGVLAVQGNFREHAAMLRRLGVDAVEVRRPEQLDGLDGLVVPGGESTAIRRLMRIGGLEEPVAAFPGPLFGTCAGMILFDRAPPRAPRRRGRRATRSAARWRASRPTSSSRASRSRVRGVFIRAPRIVDAGPAVEVLGRLDGEPCSFARAASWRRRSIRSSPTTRASTSASSSSSGRRRVSGHSKWSSIKHKKGAADAKRGKLFSKLTRAIIVAAREGGPDPDGNATLATAIQKARDNSMPKDNIERAIARGAGATRRTARPTRRSRTRATATAAWPSSSRR